MRSKQTFVVQRNDVIALTDRLGANPGAVIFLGPEVTISLTTDKEEELLELLQERQQQRKRRQSRAYNRSWVNND